MILEILIVGISLNFMGCGGAGAAKMIKHKKMINRDPCACQDEWYYENNRIPFWKCQDRNLDDQGKPWCYINGTNDTCKNEIYKNKIKKSKYSDNLFFRNCDMEKEGDKNEKKIRKELKKKSNELSGSGEDGKIQKENLEKLYRDLIRKKKEIEEEIEEETEDCTPCAVPMISCEMLPEKYTDNQKDKYDKCTKNKKNALLKSEMCIKKYEKCIDIKKN